MNDDDVKRLQSLLERGRALQAYRDDLLKKEREAAFVEDTNRSALIQEYPHLRPVNDWLRTGNATANMRRDLENARMPAIVQTQEGRPWIVVAETENMEPAKELLAKYAITEDPSDFCKVFGGVSKPPIPSLSWTKSQERKLEDLNKVYAAKRAFEAKKSLANIAQDARPNELASTDEAMARRNLGRAM